MTPKWTQATILTSIIAAAAYLAVVLWAGRIEVLESLAFVHTATILTLLGLSLTNYLLRFFRWHGYLIKLGGAMFLLHDLRIYIGGFALTTTPGKAGELVRTIWLRPYGITANQSMAAFFAERILDFVAVLILSSFSLMLYPQGRWIFIGGLALATAAMSALYLPTIPRFVSRQVSGRSKVAGVFAGRVAEILARTRECLSPTSLVLGLIIGMIAWSAECWAFFLLLRALGHPIPILVAASIYSFSILAGAISFLPGGLGGSEATMILLLRLVGVPLSFAVSATLLIRATTLWFAVCLGLLALAVRLKSPFTRTAEIAG
jgi:glycosyltransferase 2 family protein